jgi:hypothetical protein
MTFAGVNYLAILIATVAGFAFGAAYYMSLSKPWLAAIGKTKEEIAAEGQVTLRNGIISALFMWLGFVITTMAVNNAFGQRKASLTIIDGIHWLGVLVIQGAIVGALGV